MSRGHGLAALPEPDDGAVGVVGEHEVGARAGPSLEEDRRTALNHLPQSSI